ncbi:MAG: glycerol kinase GlpK [Flavobacteriales bacterium]
MMTEQFILALDQGTTSSRSLLIDHQGKVQFQCQKEFEQLYPNPGWVEHRPNDLWESQWETVNELLKKAQVSPAQIAGIGIANQRETTLVWDRKTGMPIHNAIVWQDRRTADYCDNLKKQPNCAETIQEKSGLIVDSYFSASKINWILNHVEGAKAKAERGELAFGTVDTWLVWKLSEGRDHITDVSNAARTMLFNIHTLAWDADLCELFDVPMSMLPRIVDNSGMLSNATVFDHPVPITGIAGDQQAALFGQQCIEPGMVKNTYGTGCFMLMNTGDKAVKSRHHLLCTVAWKMGGEIRYALEGSVFIGGAGVQWMRDELKLFDRAADIESLAQSVDSSDGVVIVPAFAGLGAPVWDPHARGSIFGMTRGTGRAHLARAMLESIALQSMDLLQCMERDCGQPISELRVDGGATENDLLLQLQANVLNKEVIRPMNGESTAMGTAFFAGLGTGFWNGIEDLASCWQQKDAFNPNPELSEYEELKTQWRRAIHATQTWSQYREKK